MSRMNAAMHWAASFGAIPPGLDPPPCATVNCLGIRHHVGQRGTGQAMPAGGLHSYQPAPCRFAMARFDFNQARFKSTCDQSSRSSSARLKPANAPIAQNGNVSSLAASSNCAVCATLKISISPSVSLARVVCATGFSVHHRRVMPNANSVPNRSRNVLRVTGARFNEASHVSMSAVVTSATVRSGKSLQNRARRTRRSFKYRALAPAARRF